MANVKNIHPGDKVQIKLGAVDITNHIKATHKTRYTQGSSQWAIVESIDPKWYGKTKVRCYAMNGSKKVIVWQVEPKDIADNIIHPEIKPQTKAKPKPKTVKKGTTKTPVKTTTSTKKKKTAEVSHMERDLFATTESALSWKPPAGSGQRTATQIHESGKFHPPLKSGSSEFTAHFQTLSYVRYKETTGTDFTPLTEKEALNIGARNISKDRSIVGQVNIPMMRNKYKRQILLNEDPNIIQNDHKFPPLKSSANESGKLAKKDPFSEYIPAAYDYSIETGLTQLGKNGKTKTLDASMTELRAVLGLPVHGDNTTAKYMRYFLYNRFKTPDINLAHNKSFTHIFFTRPDMNILKRDGNNIVASDQCLNHTESTMLWMRNPSLFKLLVDKSHSGDNNNFNLLLSSAATSFQIEDETISVNEAGKSWNDYVMQYGNAYTGRSAGTFSVNFTDDKCYSVINLLKLWIIYIDNVARGAWAPSYDLASAKRSSPLMSDSHVYTKTIDYAASVYVFKVSEDGSDILYWTKYYGVFPINTGASALSWDIAQNPGDAPKLNIQFKYSFKRDLSPISLLEFNNCAGLPGSWNDLSSKNNATTYESNFDSNYGHSARPYVGLPFIQMKMPTSDPILVPNAIDKSDRNLATLRLQFMNRPTPVGFEDKDIFGINSNAYRHK